VEGAIEAVTRPGVFRVVLPNGHRVVGHPAAGCRAAAGGWREGDRVRIELSPYDMSRGRLTGRAEAAVHS